MKTIVFSIFNSNDMSILKSFLIAQNLRCKRLSGNVSLDSIIYFDDSRNYNSLVDIEYEKHFHVQHDNDNFIRDNAHINGIENFRSFAKMRSKMAEW